jgi:uncharacterized RDD family membrane protein YckC
MLGDRDVRHATAPLGRRLLAFGVDAVIGALLPVVLVGLMLGLWIAFLGGPYWGWDAAERAMEEVSQTTFYVFFALWLLALLASLLWLVLYGLFRDSLNSGRSWGKRLLGLQVVDSETGLPCGRMASAMRNLPGLCSLLMGALASLLLPFCGSIAALVEPLAVLISAERLRLGDHWAGTRVVTTER